ncbi:hypothetical protein BK129_18880 [Paenibacillus amylolyticus]|uniref:hypothetical protein n=1 Tax=Paenibacillus amylolyticus TaxID=1451 RepID=UPI00096D63C8|nr:hypothetical protein [Paenibacillus amylolyticus]OMF04025.1 hypothetical protein BK129_18880 [Paenibacillus amylolyticus]
MSDKEKKQKLIPVRDFIYLCIILAIILIAVIAYFLGDSSRAGENLNFAATAISVVLAVIAIIMTIVDSAGQKQNVFDLKKAIDEMQDTLSEEKKVVEEFKEQLVVMEQNKTELMDEVKNFISFRDEIKDIVDKNKGNDGNESKEQTIAEIQEKVKNYDFKREYKHKLFKFSIHDEDYFKRAQKIESLISYLYDAGYKMRSKRNSDDLKILVISLRVAEDQEFQLSHLVETYPDSSVKLL